MPHNIIAIGSDHAGFALKTILIAEIASLGSQALDVGTTDEESVDYPDFANELIAALKDGRAGCGVLVCGSGIGMSIAANRHPEIRAALCHDVEGARLARQHNDANVLVLGARSTGADVARQCLAVFLDTEFEAGRHARRVAKLG